jgi:quinohemoprotein amine dehydrogenase
MNRFITIFLAVLFAGAFQGSAAAAAEPEGLTLVTNLCSGCHEEVAKGHLFRINDVRKTPEGWDMTLFRMQHLHKVEIKPGERQKILSYLADVQGLAPSESDGYRYVLEQRPDVADKIPDPELNVMCGRCHSNARYALQRRDAGEWLKHMNFHVGEWPSLEYQASSRDRYWWQIATTELPQKLGALYPLKTAAWDKWKSEKHPPLTGIWRITAWEPGHGLYEGIVTHAAVDPEQYTTHFDVKDPAGVALTGDGRARLYTGFEWRGSAKLGALDLREVYAATSDGKQMTGRWYDPAHSEKGADVQAVKIEKGKTMLMTASPAYIRAGSSGEITLLGANLGGKPDFGPGIKAKVLSSDGYRMTVALEAEAGAKAGLRNIKLGGTQTGFTVYDHIDSLQVTPSFAIARLGGGHTPPVTAQFEATGYMNGPDGKAGTADDIRIGVMAASFEAKPFDEEAARMQDVKFTGKLTPGGLFTPGGAGPNPARKYSTNNAGNLSIVATVKDGDRNVSSAAHLIVTVQRWNLPPIR